MEMMDKCRQAQQSHRYVPLPSRNAESRVERESTKGTGSTQRLGEREDRDRGQEQTSSAVAQIRAPALSECPSLSRDERTASTAAGHRTLPRPRSSSYTSAPMPEIRLLFCNIGKFEVSTIHLRGRGETEANGMAG